MRSCPEGEELRGEPLELFARERARLLLRVAVEKEVAEFLGPRCWEQGNSKGYGNGHGE